MNPVATSPWLLSSRSWALPPGLTPQLVPYHTQGLPASFPPPPPGCGNQCDLGCQWWRGVGGSKGLGCPAP